jgi:release factor glutamine methyltransferase
MGETWTVARVLEWASDDLRSRSSTSPRLDAELLLGMVLECDRVRLILDAKRPLTKPELAAYRELHKRRRRGEPVAYLRGTREFYGRAFFVDGRVLVPRPETEILVEVGLRRSARLNLCARVLDLCTGSGCVAITMKKERPTTTVVGSDVSQEALQVAHRNDEALGALVAWRRSNLFEQLGAWRGKLDLIVSNPPYVSDEDMAELPVDVRDFEPQQALAAGHDGLDVIRDIIAQAPGMLAPGGALALEVGAGQAPEVAELMSAAGLTDVETARDYAGIERVVSARRGG